MHEYLQKGKKAVSLVSTGVNTLSKIVFVFLVLTGVFLIFVSLTSNNRLNLTYIKEVDKQDRVELYRSFDEHEFKSVNGKIVASFIKTSYCVLAGELCTDDPNEADKYFSKSTIGLLSRAGTYMLTTPPASGTLYALGKLNETGFIPKTYAAQGIGMASLQPLAPIWKIFRDFSYMILVFVLIIVGFMIMFRMKLNPQTVISLESVLPKIVIVLILITFSFAIAGFLIDLMYVLIALSVNFMTSTPITEKITKDLILKDVFGGGNFIFDQFYEFRRYLDVGPAMYGIFPSPVKRLINLVAIPLSYTVFSKLPQVRSFFDGELCKVQAVFGLTKWLCSFIFGVAAAPALFLLSPWILAILILLTAMLIYFKIVFLLFTTYISIIISIIFAPIMFLAEAIPGQSGFKSWFKNLAVNLLSFPLIIILIITSVYIIYAPQEGSLICASADSCTLWRPPFLHSTSAKAWATLIGIGLMFSIPSIIGLIKEKAGVQGLPMKVGLGTYFGVGAAALAGSQSLLTPMSLLHQLPHGVQQSLRGKMGKFGTDIFGPNTAGFYENIEKLAKRGAESDQKGVPGGEGHGENISPGGVHLPPGAGDRK